MSAEPQDQSSIYTARPGTGGSNTNCKHSWPVCTNKVASQVSAHGHITNVTNIATGDVWQGWGPDPGTTPISTPVCCLDLVLQTRVIFALLRSSQNPFYRLHPLFPLPLIGQRRSHSQPPPPLLFPPRDDSILQINSPHVKFQLTNSSTTLEHATNFYHTDTGTLSFPPDKRKIPSWSASNLGNGYVPPTTSTHQT